MRVQSIGYAVFVVLVVIDVSRAVCVAQSSPTWRDCLSQPASWYGSDAAVRIADNVRLYQRQSGGWPKNIDMALPLDAAQRARVQRDRSRNDSTIDNGATYTQLKFLAKVYSTSGSHRFRQAFSDGLDLLFAVQYPNGGWPQSSPHATGYSRHITYNDNAMIGVMSLLRDIAHGKPDFRFVEELQRGRAATAVQRGIECILRCQVVVNGKKTVWCAQHDAQTLRPAPARSYELVSLSGAESISIARFLMEDNTPSGEVVDAIESAIVWFRSAEIRGIRQARKADPSLPKGFDKVVVTDAAADSLWARFYEIGTNRPIFCGRDGVKKYSLAEIEHERRVGYSWYTEAPAQLLDVDYPRWRVRVRGE